MPGPLSGYRILDFTQMVSGPMATMILADQGADVIKVEPPEGGDLTRAMGGSRRGAAPVFAVINRNKRSLAIDLKNPRGIEIVKRLAATADVVVQNFRPGRADKMGIGEADLRRANPRLIYVSISGFGERGPYADRRVYDPVIQALSGLADIQSDYRTGRPQMIRLIIPDKVTALTAAQAITAALLARERTGEGQHVKLAMLDATIAFLWPEGMARHTLPAVQMPPIRRTRDLIYETADGFITVGANSDAEWRGLAKALGHAEWIDDARFNTPVARIVNLPERLEMTAQVLKTKTTAEWIALCDRFEVPAAPVLTREEVLRDPQVLANQLIVESDHPQAGRIRQPRPAARFQSTPAEIRRQSPVLGEHTEEILREAGLSNAEIGELRNSKLIG
jgi:crotonobetainyl-CoA:carnitine CoA-transferase CaiB-like acyl-CoA transferase